MTSRTRRGLVFAGWTVLASAVLLEVVLQSMALVVREAPLDEQAQGEAYRVLAVGDSWVYGAEAPKGRGFVDQVAEGLPARLSPRPAQMFNYGRNGSNSAHVALTVMDQVERIRPHLVMVLVGQNNASNFYRVAEVEQRIGKQVETVPLSDRLRIVKLARILWANIQGSSGYVDGDAEAATTPIIPDMQRDEWGAPVAAPGPILESAAGKAYVQRSLDFVLPDPADSTDHLAWSVLFSVLQRDLDTAKRHASALTAATNWVSSADVAAAPTAQNDSEVLGRYALLRLAREEGNWRGVRHHGGALIGVPQRDALADLGAAEATLLAGDWRSARAYLASAHHRLPGFLDIIDLASRFTPQARDAESYEALEFEPKGNPTAHERARLLSATFDFEGAALARSEWLAEHPDDGQVAADQAVWLSEMGRNEEADLLAGVTVDPATGRVAPPTGQDPNHWRYHLARVGEAGDREQSIAAATMALATAEPNVRLLELAARTLSDHSACDELPEVVDRWYSLRGDANGYARFLAPCMPGPEAADRLEALRVAWGPLGQSEAWTALVKAGHRPFALLYRDFDLVLEAARSVGAQVLLLNYPNPSEDHVVLRSVLADYASGRDVHLLDLFSIFDERFSREEWESRLGPNGHCNEQGYGVMADEILAYLEREGMLATR